MAQLEEDTPEYWKSQLNCLESALETANENGLFTEDYDSYKKIMGIINAAITDLSATPPKVIEAREKFGSAWYALNKHCNSKSFGWRFKYAYGGPALLYLVGLFVGLLLLWIFFQTSILGSSLLWVPSWAFFWGSLGGILYGFWWLWQHTSRRDFRKIWYIWYILLPVMGAVLGALAYLIFIAGFIATTGKSEIESQYFVMLLSALAGFSARWAVQMIEKITELIKIG